MTETEIGTLSVTAVITLHRGLGSGLFELVFEAVLAHELTKVGLSE